MTDGLWRAVVPPFRVLDPGLHRAEALLLADVAGALPDEPGAAARLNRRLAVVTLRLDRRDRRWRLAVPHADDRAAVALAVLVAAGGDWRRVKCCVHCGRPFLDRTNGASRRGCSDHPARRR
jgi:predicted RNA-binding Zn ribbon-like protein